MQLRNKQAKPLVWEKVLELLLSGEPVTKEAFDAELGHVAYRLSTFMWRVKIEGGVVKVTKTGRKATGYQLMNAPVMQKYMDKRKKVFADAVTKAAVKSKTKTKKVSTKPVTKLKDLAATPMATPAVEVIEDKLEVTEITA
jgi:hypothetical protein